MIVLPVLAAAAALVAGPIFMSGVSGDSHASADAVRASAAATEAATLDDGDVDVEASNTTTSGALALAASEDDAPLSSPTTRPTRSGGGPGERGMVGGGGGFGGAGGGGAMRNPFHGPPTPPTEKELADAEQFIKDKLPNRYRLLSGLPRDLPVRRKALEMAAMKYRAMTRLRESDPELYDTFLQQEIRRDRAVGLVEDYRKGDAGADEELRRTVADLVDTSLRERQTRIDRLEKQLSDLKQDLGRDQHRRDALAEEETRRIRNQTNLLLDRLEGLRRFRDRNKDRNGPSSAGAAGGITSEQGGGSSRRTSESTPPNPTSRPTTQP